MKRAGRRTRIAGGVKLRRRSSSPASLAPVNPAGSWRQRRRWPPEYVIQACERAGTEARSMAVFADRFGAFSIASMPTCRSRTLSSADERRSSSSRARWLSRPLQTSSRTLDPRPPPKTHPIIYCGGRKRVSSRLMYREDAEEALVTMRELGIGFIAYSPHRLRTTSSPVALLIRCRMWRRTAARDHPRFRAARISEGVISRSLNIV